MPRSRRILLALTAAGLALATGVFVTRTTGGASVPRGTGPAGLHRATRVAETAVAETDLATDPARSAAPRAAVVPGAVAPAVADRPRTVPSGRRIRFGGPSGRAVVASDGTPGDVARRLVEAHRAELGLDAAPGEIRVVSERAGPTGHHVRFGQFVGGVQVEGAEVAAHVMGDGAGRVVPLLLAADLFAVRGAATRPVVGPAVAAAAAREHVVGETDAETSGGDLPEFECRAPELRILPEGRNGRLVWRVDVRTPGESARVYVDAADGEVVASRDLRRAADTTGHGRVFRPGPLHSSRSTGFLDRRDATSPQLEAQLFEVDLPRLDGTGRVRGTWADCARGRGDGVNLAHDWRSLTRDDDGFELVSAYFHIDRTQEEIRRLGLTDSNAESQRVSAHAISQDQSFYDSYNDELRFGDGGVDDAEDGDVVVHEYGHAIQDDMVPGFGTKDEGQAIGEGFSDFLACALHSDGAAPDPSWDVLFATWDATSYSDASPPFLRRVDRSKTYPGDLEDEPHADGEIWSRLLWDVRTRVGADDGLRLAVACHAYMSASVDFKGAADALLTANTALRAGADDDAIRDLLRTRGIPFTVPPADAPPEDVHDAGAGNDDAAHAVAVSFGVHHDLLLADDDWYAVTVPEFRRLRAQADFDAADLDLDLQIALPTGEVIAESATTGGIEVASAVAGAGGATFLVRAFRPAGDLRQDGYTLTLTDAELEPAVAGRTAVRTLAAAGSDAVTFSVGPEKVSGGRRIAVTTERRKKGAICDVRVTAPSGAVVAEFGAGRTARGATVVLDATEAGAWRIEVRPRDGTSGRFALRAAFRKPRRR